MRDIFKFTVIVFFLIQQKKELKRSRDHSSTSTPVQQRQSQSKNDTSVQNLTQTPDIGLCEGVDAFAKFCQV